MAAYQTSRIGYGCGGILAADERIDQDDSGDHAQKGDEPRRRAPGTQREECEDRAEECEEDGGTRSPQTAEGDLDHGREDQDHDDEDLDVAIEAASARQEEEVRCADERHGGGHEPAQREALGEDGKLERSEDKDVAGGHADAFAQPEVVVIRRFIGQSDQTVQH